MPVANCINAEEKVEMIINTIPSGINAISATLCSTGLVVVIVVSSFATLSVFNFCSSASSLN